MVNNLFIQPSALKAQGFRLSADFIFAEFI
ncbi:MAG: hypothetical protein RLZZ156_1982 [Deinococcota bacterium]|jgi:hypothetical protein